MLCRHVRRAAAERACGRLDPTDFQDAHLRLRSPRAYGFPAGHDGDLVHIRESDDPTTVITTTCTKLHAWIQGAKAGEFDHLTA
ncbi:hypothetical protein [Kitasatospora sp. NPDC093102]|uniref:hypothetical protein n=1 Tax=Kitasatospora sp. NPDC093102 TaxID=3155069 RepID=UPI003426A621